MLTMLEQAVINARKYAESVSDKQLPKEAFKEGYLGGFLHGGKEALKRVFHGEGHKIDTTGGDDDNSRIEG